MQSVLQQGADTYQQLGLVKNKLDLSKVVYRRIYGGRREMMKFQGKVVLVTGASRGIGAAIARAFAKEGAFVIVNYLQNEAMAEKVASECIELGGDGWAIQGDVTSEAAVNPMIEQVI